MKNIKVTIIVGGRFHAFDLAQQLEENKLLYQLVTTYPKSKVRRFNIDKKKLVSFPGIEYFKRGVHKIFGFYPMNYSLNNLFDKLASKKVKKDADVYIIWAGMALHTIKTIRKVNPKAKIILERGSTHIVEQNELLKRVTGKELVNIKTIKKELEEYKLADYIAIPSIFNKKTYIKHNIDKKKLIVNPYGVDFKLFRTVKVQKNKTFTIGYAGTLSARKNIKGIINAVNSLVNSGLNIKLKLVGNIDKKTFSEDLLKESCIDYKAAIPQQELVQFFNELDFFVINSIEEGLALVILQALSCGVPVIATENTGAEEVVDNGYNGYIIPAFSKDDLSKKIKYVYNLPSDKLLEMRKNATSSVKSDFTWNDYGKRYIQFLKTITE